MVPTTAQPAAEIAFRFRFVQGAQPLGLRKKRGSITPQALTLDGESISFDSITTTNAQDRWIMLGLAGTADLGARTRAVLADRYPLALEVHGITAAELARYINRCTSTHGAERHRQRLEAQGEGDLFRAVDCPACGACIDLSRLRVSPAIHCRFCGTVMAKNLTVMTNGATYGVCAACGLFDRIQSYRIIHLYFMVVAYRVGSERMTVCDACALKASRRAFLRNLTLLLAVPAAVYNYVKARRGRDPRLAGLAEANALAQKGRYVEADGLYEGLLIDNPHHPGLWMNQASGHYRGGDVAGAVQLLERSLEAAANYLPARNWLSVLSDTAEHAQ
jgi:hypothetical protein